MPGAHSSQPHIADVSSVVDESTVNDRGEWSANDWTFMDHPDEDRSEEDDFFKAPVVRSTKPLRGKSTGHAPNFFAAQPIQTVQRSVSVSSSLPS